MARPLREIEAEALELPVEERDQLAVALLHSLDSRETEEIQREWAREARRRADAFKASGASGTPHEEVMAELRASLK